MNSWRLNRGGASGELCSHHNGTVDARFPFAIQRAGPPADIVDNDMVVAITGTLETRPPWHPVRLHTNTYASSPNPPSPRNAATNSSTRCATTVASPQQRLQLPDAAITIGLVTSAGSAALADITGTFTAARTPVRSSKNTPPLPGPPHPRPSPPLSLGSSPHDPI